MRISFEKWMPIKRFDGLIEVSDCGRIKSNLRDGKILKQQIDNKGYLRVTVSIKGEKHTLKVHREVATAFIANPKSLPQVNHKDGNKKNNSAPNLEWVTNKENARHAIENGLWDTVYAGAIKVNEVRKRAIIASKNGIEVRYGSVSDAERALKSRHICDVSKGRRNHVKGWFFAYEEVIC